MTHLSKDTPFLACSEICNRMEEELGGKVRTMQLCTTAPACCASACALLLLPSAWDQWPLMPVAVKTFDPQSHYGPWSRSACRYQCPWHQKLSTWPMGPLPACRSGKRKETWGSVQLRCALLNSLWPTTSRWPTGLLPARYGAAHQQLLLRIQVQVDVWERRGREGCSGPRPGAPPPVRARHKRGRASIVVHVCQLLVCQVRQSFLWL